MNMKTKSKDKSAKTRKAAARRALSRILIKVD
jgi:hypothetical protein